MKTNKRFYLAAAILALIGVSIFTVGFAGLDFDVSKLTTDDPYVEKRYTADGDVRAVTVEDENVTVHLVASEDARLHVDYLENEKRFYTIQLSEDGALSIRKETDLEWTDHILNLPHPELKLTLRLPEGFDGDVSVSNGNGDITAEAISAASMKLHTINQATTLSDVSLSGGLTIDTGNGSVTLAGVTAVGALEVGMSNGRLTLTDTRAASVTADASNTEISLTAVTADAFVKLGTANGGMKLDRLAFGSELRCSTANGAVRGTVVGELGDFSFACNTVNGECNLPKDIAGGDKQINVNTANGDIEITFVE